MRRLVALLLLGLALAACADEEAPSGTSASPDTPVSSADEPAAPAPPPASGKACRRLAPRLVGEPIGAAKARASARGCSVRVAVRDGRRLPLTEDYSPSRINVRVDEATITGVEFLG